jgi:hypothetical protein
VVERLDQRLVRGAAGQRYCGRVLERDPARFPGHGAFWGGNKLGRRTETDVVAADVPVYLVAHRDARANRGTDLLDDPGDVPPRNDREVVREG